MRLHDIPTPTIPEHHHTFLRGWWLRFQNEYTLRYNPVLDTFTYQYKGSTIYPISRRAMDEYVGFHQAYGTENSKMPDVEIVQ